MELDQFFFGVPKDKLTDKLRNRIPEMYFKEGDIADIIEGSGNICLMVNEVAIDDFYARKWNMQHIKGPNYDQGYYVRTDETDILVLQESIRRGTLKLKDKDNVEACLEETLKFIQEGKYEVYYWATY